MTTDDRAVRHASGPPVYSRAAPTYNRVGPRPFTHFARRLVDRAAVAQGARVLDVATGTGTILLAAAERAGERGVLVGVDLSEEMLGRAADEVRQEGLANVELRVMDAQRLELRTSRSTAPSTLAAAIPTSIITLLVSNEIIPSYTEPSLVSGVTAVLATVSAFVFGYLARDPHRHAPAIKEHIDLRVSEEAVEVRQDGRPPRTYARQDPDSRHR